MIILGIDPGSIYTGYGIIKYLGNNYQYIACGVIHTESSSFDQRLKIIYQGIEHLIKKYSIEVMSIEQVFMGLNPSGAIKLGMARGSAIVAAANHNIPVFEYSALQAKVSVTGTGAADKPQIQRVVTTILNLPKKPPPDAADGLALAITHAKSLNIRFLLARKNSNDDHKLHHKLLSNTQYRHRRVRTINAETNSPLDNLLRKRRARITPSLNSLSKKK